MESIPGYEEAREAFIVFLRKNFVYFVVTNNLPQDWTVTNISSIFKNLLLNVYWYNFRICQKLKTILNECVFQTWIKDVS